MALAQQILKMTIPQPFSIVWGCWWSIILSTIIILQLLRRIRFTQTSSGQNISRIHAIQNIVSSPYGAAIEHLITHPFQIFSAGFLIIHLTVTWRIRSVFQLHEKLIILATITSLLASGVIFVSALLGQRFQQTRALAVFLSLSLVRDLITLTFGISDPYIGSDHLIKLRACWEGAWLVFHLLSLGRTSGESATSEEAAGLISKVFFFWVLPVLKEGYRTTLSLHSLPEIHSSLQPEVLRKKMLSTWTARGKRPRSFSVKDTNILQSRASQQIDIATRVDAFIPKCLFGSNAASNLSHCISLSATYPHWPCD